MINKSLFTLCFLLIALGSLFTFVASDSEAFETKFKKFVSRNSGKCLDIRGGSKRNMASLIQWDCHGGGNQQFKITKMGSRNNNDVVAIIAKHSNKCVDVDHWRTGNGTNILQYNCHFGENQLWEVAQIPKSKYAFLKSMLHPSKCLDVSGVSKHRGANVHLWDCHGGGNQQWYVAE